MLVALSMLFALAMILFGAELFTNSVEWLGNKLRLGEGAVGSVLAALGTALPETSVPVTAILLGHGSATAEAVGIGGILGAPFLLTTLGALIVAVSLLVFRGQWHSAQGLHVQSASFRRDMTFFLFAYAFALVVGCTDWRVLHQIAPVVLVALYLLFVLLTVVDKNMLDVPHVIHPLYLQWKHSGPPSSLAVVLQLVSALATIVFAAHLLTYGVEQLASVLNIPAFVLSAVLIPLATELPETLNSMVWLRQGKDALAMGNLSGAMVFQSTLVPALGIGLTRWVLDSDALLTGTLTLAAGMLMFSLYRCRGALTPGILFAASLFYWVLPLNAIAVRYDLTGLYWFGGAALILLFALSLRAGLRTKST